MLQRREELNDVFLGATPHVLLPRWPISASNPAIGSREDSD